MQGPIEFNLPPCGLMSLINMKRCSGSVGDGMNQFADTDRPNREDR